MRPSAPANASEEIVDGGGIPGIGSSVIVVFLAVTVAYAVGADLSWRLFGADNLGLAFFPPAGVTLAALVLLPRRRWWAVVAAVLVAETGIDLVHGLDLGIALGYAGANIVEPVTGALLLTRLCRGQRVDLERFPGVARFLVAAVAVGPGAGAAVGGLVRHLDDGTGWLPAALNWWAGDGLGVLAVGASILLVSGTTWPQRPARELAEPAAAMVAMVVASLVAFWWTDRPPTILVLPVLVYVAVRCGVRGVAVASTILAVVANLATAADRGPFAKHGRVHPVPAGLAAAVPGHPDRHRVAPGRRDPGPGKGPGPGGAGAGGPGTGRVGAGARRAQRRPGAGGDGGGRGGGGRRPPAPPGARRSRRAHPLRRRDRALPPHPVQPARHRDPGGGRLVPRLPRARRLRHGQRRARVVRQRPRAGDRVPGGGGRGGRARYRGHGGHPGGCRRPGRRLPRRGAAPARAVHGRRARRAGGGGPGGGPGRAAGRALRGRAGQPPGGRAGQPQDRRAAAPVAPGVGPAPGERGAVQAPGRPVADDHLGARRAGPPRVGQPHLLPVLRPHPGGGHRRRTADGPPPPRRRGRLRRRVPGLGGGARAVPRHGPGAPGQRRVALDRVLGPAPLRGRRVPGSGGHERRRHRAQAGRGRPAGHGRPGDATGRHRGRGGDRRPGRRRPPAGGRQPGAHRGRRGPDRGDPARRPDRHRGPHRPDPAGRPARGVGPAGGGAGPHLVRRPLGGDRAVRPGRRQSGHAGGGDRRSGPARLRPPTTGRI